MHKKISPATGHVLRLDLMRAALLAVLTILLWCTFYNRWTAQSWQTPLTYLADPNQADAISVLAGVRAARDGHVSPFGFTNVPELGAPYTANWDDYPVTEKPLICFMGVLARFIGLFAAGNVAVLLGQVLAALAFYAAGRLLTYSWIWSFAGALIFAFSRYFFAHGLYHVSVLYCWHIPLDLVVCTWLFQGEGIKWGERRFVFALVMAAVTGVQNNYYTFMFAQLVLWGGLLQGWRRGWRGLLPAGAVLGAAAGAFLLMNLNTIGYQIIHGANTGIVARDYKWLEIYGLKLADLVIPPPDHRFPPFAAWSAGYLKDTSLSPGELPPAGYLGLMGLAALGWLVAVSLRRVADRGRVPYEAWLVLWIILYAQVGGFNGLLGTLGFQMFRTATRYSIFILCLVLLYAVKRLSALPLQKKPLLVYGLAVLTTGIALWDQTPPLVSDQALADTAQAVEMDRHFAETLEQRLPANAMIFQLPIMEYPESPVPGIGPYDHLRLYLYSHTLRFSFGADKGRPQTQWSYALSHGSLDDIISHLESYGFSAIYVNRNAYADRGAGLIDGFKNIGLTDLIENDKGDLFCVLLKPSPQPVLPFAN